MFTRYAYFDAEVLDVKGSPVQHKTASLAKVADFESFRTDDGFMYVRIRAISSRVNKNHDGWPSVELAGSPEIFKRHQGGEGFTIEAADGSQEHGFATFVGKPIFVDHNNSNPRKARGVIVDSKFRVLDRRTSSGDDYWKSSDVDTEHLPACEVELLLEVDAKSYPKFAKAILNGDLDGFSMGANVEYTKCSHCGQVAHDPAEFCSHVLMKGAHHDFKTADGKSVSRRSYENCYKVAFFEISGVFDPADETALAREVRASVFKEGIAIGPDPQDAHWAPRPDPLRDFREDPIEQHAHRLMNQYGYDRATAVGLAQEKNLKDSPMPAIGNDGETWQPQRTDYAPSDANGMPRVPGGSPPPVRDLAGPFGAAAQEALDNEYEQRPIPNNAQLSHVKEAEQPLPQSMQLRAPDEVDTLREDKDCPVCGSEMDSETCKVCGYVAPPDGFDNPDLTKAQDVRDEMADKDEQQIEQEGDTLDPSAQAPQGPQAAPQGGPLTGRQPPTPPRKAPVAAGVTNDMRWTPQVHPKTAARINSVETPVSPSATKPTTNEPSTETVLSDQTRPVTAAMLTARRLMATAQTQPGDNMHARTADGPTPPGDTAPKTRVDVVGVGGVDEASNEAASKAEAQIDVTGVGGTGVSDVEADKTEDLPTADRKSDDAGFDTEKSTEDSGPTKTFGDSDGTEKAFTDSVTSEPFPASEDGVKKSHEDGTLEQQEQQGNEPVAQGGTAVKGVEPADSIGKAQERVNVLEHKTSPANNSGETSTWSGTDGNGVLKQQDPVTRDLPASGGITYPDVQLHTTSSAVTARVITALRLAETEIELGLPGASKEAKLNRVQELSEADPAKVAARQEALDQVKTAGLAKLAQNKTASRVPRAFGKVTAAAHNFERIASETPERQPVPDELMDSALFSR